MELFYISPADSNSNELTLDNFESSHIKTTLRKKEGDRIDLTDGCGYHYTGIISKIKPRVIVNITAKSFIGENTARICLATGFIKPNRLEFILEKGTELGVRKFDIFRSEHSNYFSDNYKRFEKITRQAIKQSNHFYLPEIKLYQSFGSFVKSSVSIKNKIAAIAPNHPRIASDITNDSEILFCVGPEGGFSEPEIDLMEQTGFKLISLGQKRLRAETAALAGLVSLKLLLGEF